MSPAPNSSLDSSQPTAMPSSLVVLTLAMLLGIQPVTTDLYLPALPALTSSFAAPMAQAQLTLSALLLAFGVSQLVWGPLSDRFGRRPVLLCGLAIYTAASVGSAFAGSMGVLIGWRVLQGAAMGAVVMCARAIVRDLYLPQDGARVMSKGLSGLGVIACISAPVGAVLAQTLGWRAVLLALAVFGAACLALIALRFTETLARPNPHALRPGTLFGVWSAISRHPTFLTFSVLSAASYGGLFTFLASSSFVFIGVLKLSPLQYGGVMFSMCAFYVAGTFLCRRLLARFGLKKAVAVAALLSLSGGSAMGLLAWAGYINTGAVLVPFWIFMLGHGVHQPCGQAGAVGPFPQAAGAASALNGFLMMTVAFAVGLYLGQRMDGSVLPLTNGVWFFSGLIAACAWTLVQRYGDSGAPAARPAHA